MRAAAVLAALLAATSTLSAQEVLLRVRPRAGQVTRYVMTMEMFMRGGPMAEMAAAPDSAFTRLTAWTTGTVTAAAEDEFTERQVIDSAHLAFPAVPQMAEMMGRMGEMVSGTTTVTRMSSRGRVVAADVTLSPAMQEMAGGMGQGPPGLGLGTDQMTPPAFWLLPEAPVRVGDSWRDSATIALDSAQAAGGTVTMAATYTLRGMEGSVAAIGFDGTLAVSGPGLPAGMTFAMSGEVRLDLAAGRAIRTAVEMSGSAPTQMGEVPMEMRMLMTGR